MDNASGVAILLAISRVFAAQRSTLWRSVACLASTGEEQGELGSRYFLQHSGLQPRQFIAALNMDGGSIVPFTRLEAGITKAAFSGVLPSLPQGHFI